MRKQAVKRRKKVGTIQVDLDGLWTNLKYYGHETEINPDPVFESSIPRFLDLFAKYNVKATFFLIGRDCEVPEKVALVKRIVEEGHEIANHTYSHIFGFRNLSMEKKIEEIKKCEEIISKVIGKKPVGFKAPGYDVDVETTRILARENYLYDSSVIPTFVYPLIMKLNRIISGGAKRTHGPKWSWGMAPNKMYQPSAKSEWRKGKKGSKLPIIELPCSVMPLLRLPFHATFATKFGLPYFKLSYNLLKETNNTLNYEFHATDLCDNIKDKRMPHLNAISLERKMAVCEGILKLITKDYEIVTSTEMIMRNKSKRLK